MDTYISERKACFISDFLEKRVVFYARKTTLYAILPLIAYQGRTFQCIEDITRQFVCRAKHHY